MRRRGIFPIKRIDWSVQLKNLNKKILKYHIIYLAFLILIIISLFTLVILFEDNHPKIMGLIAIGFLILIAKVNGWKK